ncbi:MAG: hypothetical protein AAFQ98_13145 [Bacteroidota bacterium]
MRISLLLLILLSAGIKALAQNGQAASASGTLEEVLTSLPQTRPSTSTSQDSPYLYTEHRYLDAAGSGIILQNSLPKGGGSIEPRDIPGFTLPDGTYYSFGLFWTRVINKTESPLTFTLHFPADSFPASATSGSHFKLMVPQDTMRTDRLDMYNYGATGLRPFVEANFYQPSTLRRTVAPQEETAFFVTLLLHMPEGNGAIRSELTAKGQALQYHINLGPQGEMVFPVGKWVLSE